MIDDSGGDLSGLFDAYKQRAKEKDDATFNKEVEQSQRSDECRKVIRETIVPVLLEAADQIKRQGHKADVDTRTIDNYVNPRVVLSFSPPPPKGASSSGPDSTLTFQCGGKDKAIRASWLRWGGRDGRGEGESGSVLLTDVSVDWAKKIVHSFVKNVLEHS